MALTLDELSLAMSNLALLEDNHPTHTIGDDKAVAFSALLADKANNEEAMFMLLTYCLDVSKRFAILNSAIAMVCKDPEPTKLLALLIKEDNDRMNPTDIDRAKAMKWKERAGIAADQLKKWHDRAHAKHDSYLQKNAAEGRRELDQLQLPIALFK